MGSILKKRFEHLYDSEDTIISHVINNLINTLMNASFVGFLIMVVVTGMDKLYRKTFPNFISLRKLIHIKNFTIIHHS